MLPFSRLNRHSTVPSSLSSGTDLTFCVAFLPEYLKWNSSQDICQAAKTVTRLKLMRSLPRICCGATRQAGFPLPISQPEQNKKNNPVRMEGTERNDTSISSRSHIKKN